MKTGKLRASTIIMLLTLVLSPFVAATAQTGPTITNLSPSAGPVSPVGGPISIKGSGFGATQGSSTVTVGGVTLTPSSCTATKIVVPVLASLPVGFDDVVVTVNGAASNARSFLLIPVITSVSPPNGVVGT